MDLTPTSITAFMLGLNSRIATFSVQRDQRVPGRGDAGDPARRDAAAMASLGTAERALQLISAMVVLLGMVSLVALLVSTLQERRREMAILRATGARPGYRRLLVVEAVATSAVACVPCRCWWSPALPGAAGAGHLRPRSPMSGRMAVAWRGAGVSAVAGLVPALLAYRHLGRWPFTGRLSMRWMLSLPMVLALAACERPVDTGLQAATRAGGRPRGPCRRCGAGAGLVAGDAEG